MTRKGHHKFLPIKWKFFQKKTSSWSAKMCRPPKLGARFPPLDLLYMLRVRRGRVAKFAAIILWRPGFKHRSGQKFETRIIVLHDDDDHFLLWDELGGFPLPSSQTIMSEQLVQGRYAETWGSFEPVTLRLQGKELSTTPPYPIVFKLQHIK